MTASESYDLEWLLGLDMGPNPLRLLEQLLEVSPIARGARVRELGFALGAELRI